MSTADDQRRAAEDYLYKHSIPQLFTDLSAALATSQPVDPINYLINQLEMRRNGRSAGHRVVFVLGGPGAGKGTVCARLVKDFGFKHLSAGDLLREEQQRPGSKYGAMIAQYIREGQIVPKEVTIGLLRQAMEQEPSGTTFLIDGFPRAMDQATQFESDVQRCDFVLFLECTEEVMEKRLLKRGETSGRSDDNIESIRKRFHTYLNQTMPVIEFFSRDNRVRHVSSAPPAEEVYQTVRKLFE